MDPPPVCTDISATVTDGSSVQVQLACTGQTAYVEPSAPAHGTLSNFSATAGTITYTPAAAYLGADSFTFTASNAVGASYPATATITVNPALPPVDTTPPAISGQAKAGQRLSCATGSWKNSPIKYVYQWDRDGTPIQAATGSTYVVQKLDDGTTLTCTVTASNSAGAGSPATSKGFNVSVPVVKKCPAGTGSLSGSTLGLIRLGMTRDQVRHEYTHSSTRGSKYKDFFCLTPFGVRVGYASPKLLGELPKRERGKYAGRVIWASTDNARYAVAGIRAGATLTAAEKALPHGYLFRVGLNDWYIAPVRGASAVLKVRQGIVEEVGIAVKQLTGSHKADRELMTSFD